MSVGMGAGMQLVGNGALEMLRGRLGKVYVLFSPSHHAEIESERGDMQIPAITATNTPLLSLLICGQSAQ